MRFALGSTRFVILIGPYAIKFACFRPIWIVKRFIEHWRNGEARLRLTEGKQKSLIAGVIRYPFGGIIGNLQEARLWKESRDPRLVPTLYSFGGIVNVQRRGRLAAKEEMRKHPFPHLLSLLPAVRRSDAADPINFCWYEGRLCLLDYGAEWAATLFSRSAYRQTVPVPARP